MIFVDQQKLWTRVTSSPFLLALNRNKIRVRTEHTIDKKGKEGAPTTVGVFMGRAPKLFVIKKLLNW